jgi:hypothetical protein
MINWDEDNFENRIRLIDSKGEAWYSEEIHKLASWEIGELESHAT